MFQPIYQMTDATPVEPAPEFAGSRIALARPRNAPRVSESGNNTVGANRIVCQAIHPDRPRRILGGKRRYISHRDNMNSSVTIRRPRWSAILVGVVLATVAILVVRPLREPVLRAAGWALVVNGPVAPADIIVVSLDSGGAGALEAADLVHSGVAKRVAVFMDPPGGEDLEFIRRGLPYEDEGARQVRQLKSLGVTDIVQIPESISGTEGEGQILPLWCAQHQIRSIVFVSAKDHSRRVRRVLHRAMKDYPIRVTVQPARYSSFDPDRWWETRGGTRIESSNFRNSFSTFCSIHCRFELGGDPRQSLIHPLHNGLPIRPMWSRSGRFGQATGAINPLLNINQYSI